MRGGSDRQLGAVLGLFGAAFIVLEGLLDVGRGVLDLAVGGGGHAVLPFNQGAIFLVVGFLVGLFAVLGGVRGVLGGVRDEGRPMVAGVILIVLVAVGWLGLGLGASLLTLVGALLALVGGVVLLMAGR